MMDTVHPDDLMAHPLAHLIPPMTKDEWAGFFDDVTIYGIKEPITVYGHVIIDGHHRWKAAKELGLEEIPTRDVVLEQGESANELVCRLNIFRRHLTDDQRAMIAAKWAKENPKRLGRPPATLIAAHGGSGFEQDAEGRAATALEQAAKIFNVSLKKSRKAVQVLKASTGCATKVHTGEMSLSDARRALDKVKGKPGVTAKQVERRMATSRSRIAALVLAEREACAQLCEMFARERAKGKAQRELLYDLAKAIRERPAADAA